MTGSFLNVCISRIPEDASIFYPPSNCPKCHARLVFYDLVPLLSYLFLRGRCRSCNAKISLRYPAVEALTALLFLIFYLRWGFSLDFVALIILISLLIVISFIDLEHLVIHDLLVLMGIAAGLAYSMLRGHITDSLLGICFGFLFMISLEVVARIVLKKEALGDGDVKLVIMLGAFLGFEKMMFSIALSSILGSVIAITLILFKRLKREDYIPFAPFLALGAVVAAVL